MNNTNATQQRVNKRHNYALRHKRFGFYYGGGSLHSPFKAEAIDDAVVLVGAKLEQMTWRLNWDALPVGDDDFRAID